MVKYKPELKAQIVHEYLSTAQSTNDLSKKYHIGRRQIAKWIQGYRLNGPDVLKRRRHKRNFTADFKLNVINYYQIHEDSKGNCLDNAPVESFFHLYKTELLAGFPPCKDITELGKLSQNYVQYFNNVRTTLKTKGMTPVEYRNHALVA